MQNPRPGMGGVPEPPKAAFEATDTSMDTQLERGDCFSGTSGLWLAVERAAPDANECCVNVIGRSERRATRAAQYRGGKCPSHNSCCKSHDLQRSGRGTLGGLGAGILLR